MQPKKKILIIGQHFWPESFRINDICDYLVERNVAIDVLCGIPNYPTGRIFHGYGYFRNRKQRYNGINIRRVFEFPRGNNSNIRIFLNYISFPLASLFHVPRLLTKRYDEIFIYQLSPVMMAIAGILVGKIKKIETTMYVLDLWPENLYSVIKVKNKALRKIAAVVSHWHYRNTDKLVTLSGQMKIKLQGITKKPSDKIIVLPQAPEKIYEKDIHDEKLVAKFKPGFNIVFTGNISPAQSFNTIIDAAKRLHSTGINNINWIIVGDGMSRKWLEEEVKQAGLIDSFYFEGQKPITDMPKYMGVADLLIGCLVKSELLEATIPSKVTSYFAAGKPMVLAIDGEARDLVNKTIQCGFAGPTEDVQTLAANIRKVYELSRIERRKMGARGRAYHFKHFERNLILNKLYSFIFS